MTEQNITAAHINALTKLRRDGSTILYGPRDSGKKSAAMWLAEQMGLPFWEGLPTSRHDPALLYVPLLKPSIRQPLRLLPEWLPAFRAQGGVVLWATQTEDEACRLGTLLEASVVVPALVWSQHDIAKMAPELTWMHEVLGGHPLLWRLLINCVQKGWSTPTPDQMSDGAWLTSHDSPFRAWLGDLGAELKLREDLRIPLFRFLKGEVEVTSHNIETFLKLEARGIVLLQEEQVPSDNPWVPRTRKVRPIVQTYVTYKPPPIGAPKKEPRTKVSTSQGGWEYPKTSPEPYYVPPKHSPKRSACGSKDCENNVHCTWPKCITEPQGGYHLGYGLAFSL
jgi:hypothetical protein